MRFFSTLLASLALSAPVLTLSAKGTPDASLSPRPLLLHYDRPAQFFEEALVIGNGTIGATVYGGTRYDRLSLNDITLWTGEGQQSSQYEHPSAGQCAEALKEVRSLLFSENYPEAQKKNQVLQGHFSEAYQPLGNLNITYLDHPDTKYTEYQRLLSLDNAVALTTYKANGYVRMTEYLASAPDSVIAVRITTTDPKGITALFSLGSQLPHTVSVASQDKGSIQMTGYAAYHSLPSYYKGTEIRHLYDPQRGTRFRTILKVCGTGGTVEAHETGEVKAEGCSSVTLYICNATSFNGPYKDPAREGVDYKAIVERRASRLNGKNFADVQKAQQEDYQRFFSRVSLNLGTTPDSITKLPTDVQLRRYTERGEKNPELEALYFQFGRYLLISCSRTEGVPANLQGLWNEKLLPPWSCNYTSNINLEENYWPAEITNLSEMHQPLLSFIGRLAESGEKTARNYYGVGSGWCLAHNTDIWAMTNPVGLGTGSTKWANWNMGGAWVSTHLWEHYMFTQDKDYLRRVYPALRGAADFCMGWLVEKDGVLLTSPSTSPENDYLAVLANGKKYTGSTFYGGSADIAMVRECISDAREAARILGEDAALIRKYDDTLARLAPYKTGKKGNLLEWYHDWDDKDPQHRHQSHLFGIFPGHQPMGMERQAARSLEIKGDKTTGWSTGWRVNLFARLGDAKGAYHIYQKLLNFISPDDYKGDDARRGGGTYPNLLDAHSPFQIDGNFGGTAGVAEMLLQSSFVDGKSQITLLPALPAEWKDGAIRGLCARGGFVVDMEWSNGKVVSATITARNGTATTVTYNGKKKSISLKKGNSITLR